MPDLELIRIVLNAFFVMMLFVGILIQLNVRKKTKKAETMMGKEKARKYAASMRARQSRWRNFFFNPPILFLITIIGLIINNWNIIQKLFN